MVCQAKAYEKSLLGLNCSTTARQYIIRPEIMSNSDFKADRAGPIILAIDTSSSEARLAVSAAENVIAALAAAGESAFRIGHVVEGAKGCTVSGGAETWSARAPWSATHHG